MHQKLLSGILIIFCNAIQAAQVTNNIQSIGPVSGVKPEPYICFQNASGAVTLPLAPNQTGDANAASGNAYYAGASIRLNGCTSNDDYLGFLGLTISNQSSPAIASYSPPKGVHIAFQNAAIDATGHLKGIISFTPIEPNFSLKTPATTLKNWRFAGVNLSGLEFGKSISPSVIPNLSKEDASTLHSDLSDTEKFISMGMNTIRVPVSWDYLQWNAPGENSINRAYYDNYLKPLLETLTSAQIYTIVDLHTYMRYSTYGEQYSGCGGDGPCPDGTLVVDANAYQNVWQQLWLLMRDDKNINTKYLMFDLINEPVDVPDDSVFSVQVALIKMLRNNQFDGYILIEGNAWSGLHSWTSNAWSDTSGHTYTNATLFTRQNFINAGVTDFSNLLINVHQYLDSDFSGTHQSCLQDLSTTGPGGFNLDAFITYLKDNQFQAIVTEFGVGEDASTCSVALKHFMDYLQQNSALTKPYGFIGWTVWSSGHGFGNYPLRIRPTDYRMDVLKSYL